VELCAYLSLGATRGGHRRSFCAAAGRLTLDFRFFPARARRSRRLQVDLGDVHVPQFVEQQDERIRCHELDPVDELLLREAP
jgi:hypothetical protein